MVIQRRLYGTENFYRPYNDYVAGFGHAQGDYWAGLNVINYYTSKAGKKLHDHKQYQKEAYPIHTPETAKVGSCCKLIFKECCNMGNEYPSTSDHFYHLVTYYPTIRVFFVIIQSWLFCTDSTLRQNIPAKISITPVGIEPRPLV